MQGLTGIKFATKHGKPRGHRWKSCCPTRLKGRSRKDVPLDVSRLTEIDMT